MEIGPTDEEEVTSPDSSNGGLDKSDDGDAGLSPLSSQYSSCGESEFDRYCSANSVMGTPSVCSSMGFFHDSMDSDLASVKGSEGFSLGGSRVSRRFEESSGSTLLDRGCGFGSCSNGEFCGSIGGREGSSPCGGNAGSSSGDHGVMPMLGSMAEHKGLKDFNSEVGKKEDLVVLLKNVENVFLQGAVAARSAAENLLDCNRADEMEDERCREEDETSSRYEHSDGEDSMFNYGSDDGSQAHAYYVKNVDDKCDEDAGCGNLVLMNSAVAFGSKDWEDFELDGANGNNGIHLPANFWEQKQLSGDNETSSPDIALVKSTCKENFQGRVEAKFEKEVTVGSNDCLVDNKSFNGQHSHSTASLHTSNQITSNDGSDEYLESCSMHNIFENSYSHVHVAVDVGSTPSNGERENQDIPCDEASGIQDLPALQQCVDLPLDLGVGEASFPRVDICKDHLFDDLDDDTRNSHFGRESNPDSSWIQRDKGVNHDDLNLLEDKLTSSKGKDLEMNAFYGEIVHDMEEILLDSHDSVGMRLKQKHIMFQPEQSSPKRVGGSSTTTLGMEADCSLIHPFRIDGIEVVGAKQRKGDVSLSERLVGVREYTIYIIRVWSGQSKWDVERRYRDFYTLYHRLKTYFATQEWILPPPWASVERESRKLFGNSSPHVVSERSTLIQECLSSILDSRYLSSLPSALVLFLSPPEAILSSFQSNEVAHQSNSTERVSTLGKTISLIVNIQPQTSLKELLDKQHYTCAGCHKDFDNGKTRMHEFVLNFGWGKPRLCEYTGQLFCSSCHTHETMVLPARVLHHWDFTPYPVSQLAKSYLDSIIDKPMLCVNAVNPYLLSKVPTLLHIVGIRRKIGTMLPHIRCTYRRSIYRRLGYRKYLLETNDFFALRDLIDLSKGAFAALPAILEAVLKKMQEHIIELCLECCDNGIPCGARRACSNPSSLIFPFQEEQEIRRCKSCKSVFHKDCFSKLAECPCGLVFKEVTPTRSLSTLTLGNVTEFDVKSPVKFISSFFTLSKQEKSKDDTDEDNVILMGSLPTNSL
ncbi:uncharacterized protein LOC141653144 [Silene latifolia]|uniref:uncharacterized protein LOC141653144 n=1 Tax=Silene latifolia TaxID=37657 RepID=UPI003D785ABE